MYLFCLITSITLISCVRVHKQIVHRFAYEREREYVSSENISNISLALVREKNLFLIHIFKFNSRIHAHFKFQ